MNGNFRFTILLMRFLRIASIALLLFGGRIASAQVRSFSPDPAVFIKEFETHINTAGNKSLNSRFAVFKESWTMGRFSPNQQKSIMRICSDMVAEGMPVQPHFDYMLQSVTAYLEMKLPEKVLQQWQQMTQNLLSQKSGDYLDFLKMTSNLFSSRTLLADNNKKWVVDSSDFDILLEKGEIVVKFPPVNLTCFGPADKMVIVKTAGVFYPAKKVWKGTSGQTNFDRVMPGENVVVKWGKFSVNLEESDYSIDTATLQYSKYFGSSILGKFQDKISFSPDTATVKKSAWPKFSSFANSLEIKGIVGPNATFKGGFTVNGAEINTQTANGEETEINILYKNKKRITLKSKTFKIAQGAAASLKASMVVYVDSATITHPAVNVNFQFIDNKLVINRGTEGLMRAPFYDDYHKVDIDVQQIRWKLDEPFIDFDNINNDQDAKLSSADFYKEMIYARVQGPLSFNPLESLYAFYNRQPEDPATQAMEKELKALIYKNKPEDKPLIEQKLKALQARKKETREFFKANRRMKFSVADYAQFCKMQPEHLKSPFIELHDAGYITYFPEQDSAVFRTKLFRWVQSHEKTRDYDVIRLSSTIAKRSNMSLNLLSHEMNVDGVQKFFFSDSQNVVVVPYEQQITLLKNRRIRFGGMVRAGRFDFFGKKFEFDYGNFLVQSDNIDSLRLYFPDSTGRSLIPIKSVLRNIYGTIYIDKPNNKSGLVNYPEYPIFKSLKGSEVLYDKPSIHGGQYKAETFKFVVDPFTIDSLDNFTIAGLRFDGTFKSDGIFPEFRHYVYIQPDYSLGFVTPTPPGGYTMYRGKGKGEMVMNLSERGFYGEQGDIAFNGSTTKFQRILLLPKAAKGNVDSYDLPQSGIYPQVYASNAEMEWTPYHDKFNITNGPTPIKVFKTGYDFTGTVTQKPSKLTGNGSLKWPEAKFASNEMVFGPNKTAADKANLTIYGADSSKVAFETNDIRGVMDFDTRLGTFTTNKVGSQTRFPFNSYATNLNDYRWDMNGKTLEARTGASMAGTQPYWISTNPTQDSLKFAGVRGIYNLKDYTLNVQQIPFIDVADSRVFLKDGKVTIRENGDMDIVDSAKLIANRIDKFHEIYRSRMKIYGKNKMRGSGLYQYVNKLAQRQEFFLDSIVVNKEKHIEAWGRIDESLNFTLDTKIGYKGFAQILSNEQNIQFTGYVKPLHTFKNILPSAWLRYSDRVDPKNVIINVQDPRDKDNKKQYVGLFVANDSSHVYPLFFSWKRRYSDPDVTNDTGIFYYDHEKQSFFAGSKDKLLNDGLKGSFIQLNEKNHTVHAEGPLDFGLESDNIKFKNAGTADLREGDSSFVFNLAMMLDFPLHKDYVSRLKELFQTSSGSSVNINTEFFKNAVGEMVSDDKTARTIIKNIEKSGEVNGKDEAEYKLILSDATFRWDSKLRGMYCNDNVSVASFAGTPVNKDIKTTMLLEHKRGGENMYIYFDFGGNEWIYINLTKTVANILSSDQKLNEILVNTAEKLPAKDYYVKPATPKQVERFLKRLGAE